MTKITQSVSKLSKLIKPIFQKIFYPKGHQHVLLIMGCQRSGTTLISNVFDQIRYARVFGEFSSLSNIDPSRIRLNPIDNVKKQLHSVSAPLVVTKPLVESQNATYLLNHIKNSHILWVIRDYKDVALSDIKKFTKSAGHGNILPIIKGELNNWRAENISKETLTIINELYSDKLNALEYACLFWYVRNILYFEQGLDKLDTTTTWSYEQFVSEPLNHINILLTKLKLKVQPNKVVNNVFDHSVGSAENFDINADITILCESLMGRFTNITNNTH